MLVYEKELKKYRINSGTNMLDCIILCPTKSTCLEAANTFWMKSSEKFAYQKIKHISSLHDFSIVQKANDKSP